jgi:leucyl aminopeptidase
MSLSPVVIDPVPSRSRKPHVTVVGEASAPVEAVGLLIASDDDTAPLLGYNDAALARTGFTGALGQTLPLPVTEGPARIAVGVGPRAQVTSHTLRDAAGHLTRAVPTDTRLALSLTDTFDVPIKTAVQAVVEGALLARYGFTLNADGTNSTSLDALEVIVNVGDKQVATEAAGRGAILVAATELARDLANCPGSILTAVRMAEVAIAVGAQTGLEVETFDRDALLQMGCGGLLGVNRGSVDEPRMIRLTYRPTSPDASTGHLTLVGKGIMYDSGGISLKPSDASHSVMKNDMTGAGDILAAMSALSGLDCPTTVVGYLMCTDNMPSGTAMKLGDVLTIRGGTTIEVLNTDAEGRLVMADGLVLATETPTDAIVDIATLTGATLRALGTEIAGVMGNNQQLVDQAIVAGAEVDEPLWQFPLAQRYRRQLDSDIADMSNMGGPNAGQITAALFLAEFVGDVPWAHIDIAGTAQADAANSWRNKGATGFGTRLLIDLAVRFTPAAP